MCSRDSLSLFCCVQQYFILRHGSWLPMHTCNRELSDHVSRQSRQSHDPKSRPAFQHPKPLKGPGGAGSKGLKETPSSFSCLGSPTSNYIRSSFRIRLCHFFLCNRQFRCSRLYALWPLGISFKGIYHFVNDLIDFLFCFGTCPSG